MVGKAFSVPVRLAFSFVLLAVPLLAGLSFVSPWWILPMTFVFVMADVMGKWRLLFQGQPLAKPLVFAFKALAVQPFVVGVFYMLGRGLGSFAGVPAFAPFAGGMTAVHIGLYALVMFVAGLVLIRAERGMLRLEDVIAGAFEAGKTGGAPEDSSHDGDNLAAPTEAVTLESFYQAHHYSNCVDKEGEERRVLPSAFITEADIAAKEAELGLTLPAMLRALYLLQNGGSVKDIYSGNKDAPSLADVAPFSGYEDLTPLTKLRSLHDSISDYASVDAQPEEFPRGADRMIILAQWYRETLYLDYREGAAPSVGFYDFDKAHDLRDDAWQGGAVTWPGFEAFFASLYRQDRY